MNTDSQKNETPGFSQKQKELVKKYAIFAAMGLICAGSIYVIFSPSEDEKAKREQLEGFNAEMPMPRDADLINDKRIAYEQEQIRQRQSERMRSLQDFSALINGNTSGTDDGVSLTTDDDIVVLTESIHNGYVVSAQPSPIEQSANAYRDMNRALGSFYERPREDPEKEQLKQELEELKTRMEEAESRQNPVDQLEFMEKSFQMASKYMPGLSATAGMPPATSFASTENSENAGTQGNNDVSNKTAVPVAHVRERTVSALLPEMSDAEFIEAYSRPRNFGFLTVKDETDAAAKNTVSACIHADQTVMDGQNVRLRLLDPIHAGSMVIPRNTMLTGTARIQGERLQVTVNSLEYAATILPVELRVYDLDGQSGIFVPNMQELNAAKEIVANMGTSAGTSITLSDDAGKQFVADMSRNVIQGVSQFTAKKLREVKVHLKAGYRVYLISEESLKTGNTRIANR